MTCPGKKQLVTKVEDLRQGRSLWFVPPIFHISVSIFHIFSWVAPQKYPAKPGPPFLFEPPGALLELCRSEDVLPAPPRGRFPSQKWNSLGLYSRKLTYPTWGKGKSSSNMPYQRDMLIPGRVCTPSSSPWLNGHPLSIYKGILGLSPAIDIISEAPPTIPPISSLQINPPQAWLMSGNWRSKRA